MTINRTMSGPRGEHRTTSGHRQLPARPKMRRALSILATCVAAVVFATIGGSADADAQILPGAPIGPPFFVDISHDGQLAIAAGYAAAPGAIVCMVTTGVACAVTPAIVAFITPIVQRAMTCPNNEARRIEIQNRLIPPRPGGIRSEIVQFMRSNTCISA